MKALIQLCLTCIFCTSAFADQSELLGAIKSAGFSKSEATIIVEVMSQIAEAKDPDKWIEDNAIRPTTIFKDYEANEVSADGKYKGKALIVRGKVSEIAKDAFGHGVIYFFIDTYGMKRVAARMADNQPESDDGRKVGIKAVPMAKIIGAVTKGQIVSMFCRGKGMTLNIPMLGDCLLNE